MYKIDERLSASLRNLTCICTILIILLHLPMAIVRVEGGLLRPIVFFVKDHFSIFAVPLFFAMSGFLLAQRVEERGWYGRALRSRNRTLVIPYFAINTLLIPFLVVYHNVYRAGEWLGNGLGFDWYTISRVYGLTIYSHPASGPLWYVRCLMMFIVVSPLLVWVIRQTRAVAIIWLVACAVIVTLLKCLLPGFGAFFYSFINLQGIWCFSCGIALALYGRTLSRRVTIGCLCLAVIGVIVIPRGIPAWGLVRFMCGGWILWQVASFPFVRSPRWFASSCFALYAFHEVGFRIYAFAIRKSSLELPDDIGVIVPLILVITVICLAKWFLAKFMPSMAEIILGGRT